MILYPAIDLKDGACVRLRQGEMDQATVFNQDPGAQAKQFADAGCEWIHVVDLNGAFEGKPVNGTAVDAILAAVDVPVQLGGGIRSLDTAADWLARGVRRIVLGTVAVKDPDLVIEACRRWPDRVAVGIDARGGFVAVEGWAEQSTLSVFELAARFEDAGVAAIVYTDIDRDGMMQGVNVEATASLAEKTAIPVIASGGIASLDDLRALKARGGIAGAISGRALYDGRLDISAALAALKAA
ncbi:MAG: 1-(5-phosphoribosyl)-5-[(5-phosphoribosylamino)methylideneamino]imidazole-4-carboxamide isomerase [Rhodospirillaceae bacterium]|nr:1-(5-phosphoribosyl)-5-[(5-phosphoribosylamino)methylideneamino]imidazole-4-carboxamide isomerase [Rhodospirillaceae bacterium]MDD9914829.1 1-(5-phosphoribosyl)-5-[(5-phosphoribosylamino)methylideneamino]imidazole-4-carboxamide isomerase [Rhodospirillaceae bacterium]MDD9929954.1 1-(5-phosphoribosyl)-5-[(5-phosphoribosylamino)methylideneamino]imidazole-4-carboxamide isomerase [Rhodospirillaceae bacterium]